AVVHVVDTIDQIRPLVEPVDGHAHRRSVSVHRGLLRGCGRTWNRTSRPVCGSGAKRSTGQGVARRISPYADTASTAIGSSTHPTVSARAGWLVNQLPTAGQDPVHVISTAAAPTSSVASVLSVKTPLPPHRFTTMPTKTPIKLARTMGTA